MVAFGGSKHCWRATLKKNYYNWPVSVREIALFSYVDECLNVGYMHKSLLTSSLYIQGKGWYKGPRGEINANFQWEIKTNCLSPPHFWTNQVLQFHYLPISCCYKWTFSNVFVFQLLRKNCVTPFLSPSFATAYLLSTYHSKYTYFCIKYQKISCHVKIGKMQKVLFFNCSIMGHQYLTKMLPNVMTPAKVKVRVKMHYPYDAQKSIQT